MECIVVDRITASATCKPVKAASLMTSGATSYSKLVSEKNGSPPSKIEMR